MLRHQRLHRAIFGHLFHHLVLTFPQHFKAGGQELRHHGGRLRCIGAHEVIQNIHRQHILAAAFVFCDDLQKILTGQVITRFQINDLNLSARADHSSNIVQGHVVAGFGIIEPAARVTLDQKRVFTLCQNCLPRFSALQQTFARAAKKSKGAPQWHAL